MNVFPSMRYHPALGAKRVETAADAAKAAAEGWFETPADFPPPEPADPTKCAACGQKLKPAKAE